MCHIKHWKEISSELLNRSNCHVTPTVNSFMRTKWCFEGLLQHLKSVETYFILIFQPYLFIIISHFSIIFLYIIIFSLFPIFLLVFCLSVQKEFFFFFTSFWKLKSTYIRSFLRNFLNSLKSDIKLSCSRSILKKKNKGNFSVFS